MSHILFVLILLHMYVKIYYRCQIFFIAFELKKKKSFNASIDRLYSRAILNRTTKLFQASETIAA